MIKRENKYDLNINNSIIISSVDSVTLLGIKIDHKLNFKKHVSTIISFYLFLSSQYSVLYTHLYIINVFLFILSLYKSCTVFIRSSLSFVELTFMLLQNDYINNGVTNGLK